MERWRELAETVPGTLLSVALDTGGGLLGTVCSAHTTLDAVARTLRRMLLEGAPPGDIRDATAGLFCGASPSSVLEGALVELARLDVLHAGAGQAYNLYARRYALVRATGGDREALELLYQRWQDHLRGAVLYARDARRKLRAAAAEARAAENACCVLRSFPHGAPDDWTLAWTSAAWRLALHAAVRAGLAFFALLRMHNAVALEFHDACRMLPINR
jgi:hypothetical protein